MKKTTPKKKAKKSIKKVAKKKVAVRNENNNMYKFIIKFNDLVYSGYTNDISEAILSISPVFLKTKATFEFERNDGKSCNKILFVPKGRLVFRGGVYLRTFIRSLIFK